MKPKRWVGFRAVKRWLVMPSCVCGSCSEAAAVRQRCLLPPGSAARPCAAAPRLFLVRGTWIVPSPLLVSLCVSHLCSTSPARRVCGDGREGRAKMSVF